MIMIWKKIACNTPWINKDSDSCFLSSLANWSNKLGNGTMVLKEMKRAFKLWEGYSGLRFVESKTFDDSDITISFGSGYHGDW